MSVSIQSIHWFNPKLFTVFPKFRDPLRHWTLESVLRQGQSNQAVESAPLLMGEEALALIFRSQHANTMKIHEAMRNPTWDPKQWVWRMFFLWSNDITCWACCNHWHFGFHHWLQGCLRFHDLCWSVLSAHRMGIDWQSEEMAKPIWNVVSETVQSFGCFSKEVVPFYPLK